MRNMKKIRLAAVVVSVVLLVGVSVSGTLAWILAQSNQVTNTFTTSGIGITLTETATDFKMIPGDAMAKDPKVTVDASITTEPCCVFIKIEESANLVDYIAYAVDLTKWAPLTGVDGVYYYKDSQDGTKLASVEPGTELYFLTSGTGYVAVENNESVFKIGDVPAGETPYIWDVNEVLTLPTVKKEDMAALKEQNAIQPTLTFTAYACQYSVNDVQFTPEEAWAVLNPTP